MAEQSDRESENSERETKNQSESFPLFSAEGGGTVIIENVEAESADTAFEVSEDTTLVVDDLTVDEVLSTGGHVRDGNLVARNMTLKGGDYGLDLHRGARGDIFDSSITEQTEDSIRYDRNVKFGLYDVRATSLRDRFRGQRITDDEDLLLNEVLNTTSKQIELENRIEIYKRTILYLLQIHGAYSLADRFIF